MNIQELYSYYADNSQGLQKHTGLIHLALDNNAYMHCIFPCQDEHLITLVIVKYLFEIS